MLLVGLTGGIGCGKSTVAHALQQLGLPLIDTDLIAREVVEPGTAGYQQLRTAFGSEFFNDSDDGQLLREQLGAHIFSDTSGAARRKLNGVMQPLIRKQILVQLLRLFVRGHSVVVMDCPLLVETGANKWVHKVIVVACTEERQIRRLKRRNGLSSAEASDRIQSQCSAERRQAAATYVINNEHDDMAVLLKQVQDIHCRLLQSYIPWCIRAALLCLVASITFSLKRIVLS